MTNPNPHNKFNSQTGKAASVLAASAVKAGKNIDLRIAKLGFKGRQREEILGLLRQLATNPAVVGTVLYLGVGLLKPAPTVGSVTTPGYGTVIPLPGFLGDIQNYLSSLTPNPGALGIDALQVALLAYIATGGNLAGTLQGGANVLGTLAAVIPK